VGDLAVGNLPSGLFHLEPSKALSSFGGAFDGIPYGFVRFPACALN
jgi:hypothetical protein